MSKMLGRGIGVRFTNPSLDSNTKGLNEMKADKRASKRFRNRYGHFGSGSVHTREASDLEVLRHIEKIEAKKKKGKK